MEIVRPERLVTWMTRFGAAPGRASARATTTAAVAAAARGLWPALQHLPLCGQGLRPPAFVSAGIGGGSVILYMPNPSS